MRALMHILMALVLASSVAAGAYQSTIEGDVAGPAGPVTATAVVCFPGTDGNTIDECGGPVTVDSSGNINTPGTITASGLSAAHATTHEDGGSDEISVAALSGLLADAQTPTSHAASHAENGSDELLVENLGTAAGSDLLYRSDGSGGVAVSGVGIDSSDNLILPAAAYIDVDELRTGARVIATPILVEGPSSAVEDTALACYDLTTGLLIKQCAIGVLVDSSGNLTLPGDITSTDGDLSLGSVTSGDSRITFIGTAGTDFFLYNAGQRRLRVNGDTLNTWDLNDFEIRQNLFKVNTRIQCDDAGGCTFGNTGVEIGTVWVRNIDDSDGRVDVNADLEVNGFLAHGAPQGEVLGVAAVTFVATETFIELTGDGGGNTLATMTGGVEGDIVRLVVAALGGGITLTDDGTAADSFDLGADYVFTAASVITFVKHVQGANVVWRKASSSQP